MAWLMGGVKAGRRVWPECGSKVVPGPHVMETDIAFDPIPSTAPLRQDLSTALKMRQTFVPCAFPPMLPVPSEQMTIFFGLRASWQTTSSTDIFSSCKSRLIPRISRNPGRVRFIVHKPKAMHSRSTHPRAIRCVPSRVVRQNGRTKGGIRSDTGHLSRFRMTMRANPTVMWQSCSLSRVARADRNACLILPAK